MDNIGWNEIRQRRLWNRLEGTCVLRNSNGLEENLEDYIGLMWNDLMYCGIEMGI